MEFIIFRIYGLHYIFFSANLRCTLYFYSAESFSIQQGDTNHILYQHCPMTCYCRIEISGDCLHAWICNGGQESPTD
jgi:hypothetical protein